MNSQCKTELILRFNLQNDNSLHKCWLNTLIFYIQISKLQLFQRIIIKQMDKIENLKNQLIITEDQAIKLIQISVKKDSLYLENGQPNNRLVLLRRCNLPNLAKLWLRKSNIEKLDFLVQAHFPNLYLIWLKNNLIRDLSPLTLVSFKKLDRLCLDANRIQCIQQLASVNFPELTYLSINSNAIKDITPFQKVNFPKLKYLSLNDNQINSISALSKSNFKGLKYLSLYSNSIKDLQPFVTTNFPIIESIWLNENEIINFEPLTRVKTWTQVKYISMGSRKTRGNKQRTQNVNKYQQQVRKLLHIDVTMSFD